VSQGTMAPGPQDEWHQTKAARVTIQEF